MPAPADRPTTDGDPRVAAAIAVLADRAALLQRAGGGSLLDCFAAIPDPRSKREVRHELPTILGLCTAAVLSGCVSLVEITDWVTHADQELLGALGARHDPTGGHVPPHPDTIERVFRALGAQGLADHTGAYLGGRAGLGPVGAPLAVPVLLPALAIDGKAVRGAIGSDGQIPYLLAAATHTDSTVIAERLIGAKSNEVPEFAPLLRGLPLGGWVLTIDAAHTVRAHAHFITEELLAHYVMIVKQNTKGLFQRLNNLDWAGVPVAHRSVDTGHGRHEVRTIQVMDAPADLRFPTRPRCSSWSVTPPAISANESRTAAGTRPSRSRPRSRCSGSPASARRRPPRNIWPPTPGGTGPSRTKSTGSATSRSVRTLPKSRPDPAPESWPPSVTW
ncbi:MAG: ISAs1 family transposase [Actinomycetota bacterium]|nr:ISAs1 family transposase [Actinomycetota bacterium]